MADDPPEPAPEYERHDAAAPAADLARRAQAATDATFSEDESTGRTLVPGVISGDVGPKARIAAQHRALSRTERTTYGDVPRGTVVPGGGLLLLVPLVVFALVILAVVFGLGWLLS
jgi:hypothetical protein